MLYDEEYSFDVSLSEILDEFIYDNTSPDIILNFLSKYKRSLAEVFRNSACYKRIFQIDFYLNCSSETKDVYWKIVKASPKECGAYICWQMCSRYFTDILSSFERNYARTYLYEKLRKLKISHPYALRHEKYTEELDDVCSQCIHDNKTLAYLGSYFENNSQGYQHLFSAMRYLDYSLFKWRLMQYDVFSLLSDEQKFIYIKSLEKLYDYKIVDIMLQIFDSDEKLEIKKAAYDMLTSIDTGYYPHTPEALLFSNAEDKEILKILNNSSSFAEVQLQTSLTGILVPYKKIAFWLLLNKKKKMLKEWLEYDKEMLNSALNIGELVPCL